MNSNNPNRDEPPDRDQDEDRDDSFDTLGPDDVPTGVPPFGSTKELLGRYDTVESADNEGAVIRPVKGIENQIGPYRILRKIAEGGMGAVYLAEQRQPIRRRVALKVIKGGRDSQEIVTRFEAERQALAMMDHPNIAKVLDGGTTKEGSPYFAMELVKGVPLTQYCDENKLSIRARLELFIPVCKAVQHAHQKGIIHRDLKPSNVLVATFDGEPVPKVIDFGLAKATEHQIRLTDKTMFTEYGAIVGTLQYMSPEQAEMDRLDVDTRTDIYSLGVMLYELLTGSTPLDQSTMGQHALLKVLEIIREKEPPRPSTRISESSDTLSGVSQFRQIQPSKLRHLLRGELDWIVMKALEKTPTRRYVDANAFADDINNYLSGASVAARPPSLAYQTSKYVQRNKGFFTAAAVTLGALLLGSTASFFWNSNSSSVTGSNASTDGTASSDSTTLAASSELDMTVPVTPLIKLQAPFVAREAKREQQIWADFLGLQTVYKLGPDVELTVVPPGEFEMGSQFTQEDLNRDFPAEVNSDVATVIRPQRDIKITQPFAISTHEITLGQFRAFVKDTGYQTDAEAGTAAKNPSGAKGAEAELTWKTSKHYNETDEFPVTLVSWNDSQAFCNWLSKKTGHVVRLPYQVEWEYACRAGTQTPYYCGYDPESLVEVANVPNRGPKWQRIDLSYEGRRRVEKLSMIFEGNPERITLHQSEEGEIPYYEMHPFVGNKIGRLIRIENETKIDEIEIEANGRRVSLGSKPVNIVPSFIDRPASLMGSFRSGVGQDRWFELPSHAFTHEVPAETWGDTHRMLPGTILGFVMTGNGMWQWVRKSAKSCAMCRTSLLQTNAIEAINLDEGEKLEVGSGMVVTPVLPQQSEVVALIDVKKTDYIFADDGYGGLAPVKQFRPNAFGIHDMHGNVWEWCQDGFDLNYANCPPVDPRGSVRSPTYAIRGACYI